MKLSPRSTHFEGFSFAVLSLDRLDLNSNYLHCGETESHANEHLEENNENKYRLLSVH